MGYMIILVRGIPTILRNMMGFVSWDDDEIPNIFGKSYNSMVPNQQPEYWQMFIYSSLAGCRLDVFPKAHERDQCISGSC